MQGQYSWGDHVNLLSTITYQASSISFVFIKDVQLHPWPLCISGQLDTLPITVTTITLGREPLVSTLLLLLHKIVQTFINSVLVSTKVVMLSQFSIHPSNKVPDKNRGVSLSSPGSTDSGSTVRWSRVGHAIADRRLRARGRTPFRVYPVTYFLQIGPTF